MAINLCFSSFWRTEKTVTNSKDWNLIPLTPEYIEEEHGCYVKAITSALDNPGICNIALSGNYGVGKSSILQKVAALQKNCVVELSLSTLAPFTEYVLDESVPKQASTPTNRIQQEIVKQLLYRAEPNRTPRSRFRRIERFSWLRELVIAFIASLAVTVIFLLTGWTKLITAEIKQLIDIGLWSHVVLLVLAACVVFTARYLLQGRIHIRQLSAGSATVTLDETSISYFDQYLDEIVYFFEVSSCNIVIFEDIDRFNDSHIFETLRSLNTLLNASPQIAKPIRFIYAVKDSIFDRIGIESEGRQFEKNLSCIEDPAQAETVRANRTKFFDLVIPVVPFITHRSARNLTTQLLRNLDHNIAPELIDLAGKYVPDMRLLKNACNEFIIFRDRIFSGDGKHLNLSETDLFAMMLYKGTHLADFEAIRIGNSRLDQLYNIGRSLVATNVQRIEREERHIRYRLKKIDGIATQSVRLGDQLIKHLERTLRAVRYNKHDGKYQFNNEVWTADGLRSANFWTEFVKASEEPELTWRSNYQSQHKLIFTRADILAALNESLEPENWDEAVREELNETLQEKIEQLKFLRRADMGDLIKRSEFLVEYEESMQPLDAITCQLLTAGLAYNMIRAGYINRNFTLYTSTFHGDRVSSAATNFIIHHVERNMMDEHFKLDKNDIEAVIRECGKKALEEPAFYNIDMLDHLLRNDLDTADIMIDSLVRFASEQKRFMQAYLNVGSERARFIERFTKKSPHVLVYLVSQIELDAPAHIELISAALENLADNLEYRVDSAVSEYLRDHYAEIPCLISTPLAITTALRIGKVFFKAAVKVPALKPLREAVRNEFIAQNLYLINRENLKIALKSDASLALDLVRESDGTVYRYVLDDLKKYLAAINGISASIDLPSAFISIIEDVLDSDVDYLSDIIEHASEGCVVDNLEDVSEDAWPHLAQHQRFPATLKNVSRYINSAGSLDENIGKILTSAVEITESESGEETEKVELAKTILSAIEYLPSASLRTQLVASLELENYLEVSEVRAENGELFALLLAHNIIRDDAETYAHLLTTNWPTRELIIQQSKCFKEYMDPSLLHNDLEVLLLSEKIDLTIKTKIANNASEYIKDISRTGLAQLAKFCLQEKIQVTPDVIEKCASHGVPTQDVVDMLEPHLAVLSDEQLFSILRQLDGDYPQLTTTGRDHPKIPHTTANCALLEVLKLHGIVNSYNPDANPIRVNKRHK